MRKILIPAIAALIAAASCGAPSGRGDGHAPISMDTTGLDGRLYHLETMRCGSGYGYKIAVEGKDRIVQDIIPVLQGNQGFRSPEKAFIIGQCAIRQMASGMMLPSISWEDLIMYGIINDDGSLRP